MKFQCWMQKIQDQDEHYRYKFTTSVGSYYNKQDFGEIRAGHTYIRRIENV